MNKYILRAIEEHLQKCSVTLKDVRQKITPIIKDLTDTLEEQEKLIDTITHFYRDTYNLKHETCIIEDHNGNQYKNDGEKDHVEIPPEAAEEGHENGLLYGIHNHPDTVGEQSGPDFLTMANLNQKYSICTGKGTITIAKNTNGKLTMEQLGMLMFNDDIQNSIIAMDLAFTADTNGLGEINRDFEEGKINVAEHRALTEKRMNRILDKNFERDVGNYSKGLEELGLPITYKGVRI